MVAKGGRILHCEANVSWRDALRGKNGTLGIILGSISSVISSSCIVIPLLCVLALFSEDTHIITQPERPSGKATSVIFSCRLKLPVETPLMARSSLIQQGGELVDTSFFGTVLGRGRETEEVERNTSVQGPARVKRTHPCRESQASQASQVRSTVADMLAASYCALLSTVYEMQYVVRHKLACCTAWPRDPVQHRAR